MSLKEIAENFAHVISGWILNAWRPLLKEKILFENSCLKKLKDSRKTIVQITGKSTFKCFMKCFMKCIENVGKSTVGEEIFNIY